MPWFLTDWAMCAMYRRFMWFLTRQEPEVIGQCKCCGQCCKEIVLDAGKGWLRSKRQFERIKAQDKGFERFTPTGKDEAGRLIFRCECLGEDNLCTDYQGRMKLCRDHPSKGLYYSGVVLGPHCGYKLRGPTIKGLIHRLLGRKPMDFNVVLENARKQGSNPTKDGIGSDDS